MKLFPEGTPGGEAAYYRALMRRAEIEREQSALQSFGRLGPVTRANMALLYGGEYNAARAVFAAALRPEMRDRCKALQASLRYGHWSRFP